MAIPSACSSFFFFTNDLMLIAIRGNKPLRMYGAGAFAVDTGTRDQNG